MKVYVCCKSQDTGGSRKIVKTRARDPGMVVSRHGLEQINEYGGGLPGQVNEAVCKRSGCTRRSGLGR